MNRDKYRKLCFDGQLHASSKFEVDKDLIEMRSYFPAVNILHWHFHNIFRNSMKFSTEVSIYISRGIGQEPRSCF